MNVTLNHFENSPQYFFPLGIMADDISNINDIQVILRVWEDKHETPGYNPIPVLTRFVKYSFMQ